MLATDSEGSIARSRINFEKFSFISKTDKKVAEVKQVLLSRHKKSDARGLASDFQGSPARTQMLQ